MLWVYIVAILLILVGSAFSLLRSASTIDYYRTIVRDGREDSYARWVIFGYYAGLAAVATGMAVIVGAAIYSLIRGAPA